MFENIFDKIEPNLEKQMKEMKEHIRENHDHYPLLRLYQEFPTQ